MVREEVKIGDHIYYAMEDYNTGEDVIYEGYVIGFNDNQTLKLDDKVMNLGRFYNVSDIPNGEMIVGLQRNCFYTINDLFKIANKQEELNNLKDKSIKIDIVKGREGSSLQIKDNDGNGYRIAGPKAWGNPYNQPAHSFTINSKEIIESIVNYSYLEK